MAWEIKDTQAALKCLDDNWDELHSLASVASRMALNWLSLTIMKFGTDEDIAFFRKRLHAVKDQTWPFSEIFGHFAYRDGDTAGAYREFQGTILHGLDFSDLPTWSMGLSAYIALNKKARPLNIINFSGSFPTRQDLAVVIGVDEQYLPFAEKMITYSRQKNLHFSIALHSTKPVEKVESIVAGFLERVGANRVSVFVDNKPLDFLDLRNKKGYFTLLRYRLAAHLVRSGVKSKMLIPDADLIFKKSFCPLEFLKMDSDFGVLAVGKWPRPWLRFTAPLLFVNTTDKAQEFLFEIERVCLKSIALVEDEPQFRLWGVDQAAIQIASDASQKPRIENLLPTMRKHIVLAQEFEKKTDIVDFYE